MLDLFGENLEDFLLMLDQFLPKSNFEKDYYQ